MTVKMEHLAEFMKRFRVGNVIKDSITDQEINLEIGRKFGVSPYVRRTIKEALVEFGFICQGEVFGIWKIVKGNDGEKEAEEKLDALVKK